jgi:hypothetical protein
VVLKKRPLSVTKTASKQIWYQNISQIFTKNDEMQTQTSSKVVLSKCQCDCEKDLSYKFTCKHGVEWFASIIESKIRRNPD